MAKRTPDFTKQVRHEKPSRQPPAGPRKKAARRQEALPPPQKGATGATFVALGGGVALYAWAATISASGTTTKAVVFWLVISLLGMLTNILTGVLALYALNPRRFPMPRVDKRLLAVVIVVFGAVTVFVGINNAILAPGMIPPIAIFYFVIRPRLKSIAQATGTYRPTRRDAALEEIQERRAERQREKEREEQLKRTLKRRQAHEQAGGASRPGRFRGGRDG